MKHKLHKKTYKQNRKIKKNRKNKTKKIYLGSGLTEAYNYANQNAQNLYNIYLLTKDKYNTLMNQYRDIETKYQNMKQTLERIQNDPEVKEHLQTLSNLNSQLQQSFQNVSQPSPPNGAQEALVHSGGFLNSSINSLQSGLKTPSNYYNTKKQQAKAVYNDPDVKQNLNNLSKHSLDTVYHGSMLGTNIVTGAPISAAYRGYNTYKSAKKGISSASNLYSSVGNAYNKSASQPI